MADIDTTPTDNADQATPVEAPKPSDMSPAREASTDWKAEARKWEARAKANAAAAKQLEALSEQARAKDADLEALRAKVAAFKHEREVASFKEQVAADTGVPANLLRGDTLEALQEHAADLKAALDKHARPHGPIVPMAGTTPEGDTSTLSDLVGSLFKRS